MELPDGAPARSRSRAEEEVAAAVEAAVRHAVGALIVGAPAGSPIVVGCSGGPDSTCLLLALATLGRPLVAVYVDHGLRPGTEAESERVRSLCSSLAAPPPEVLFERVAVQVERRGNLMAAARRARYAALLACARRHGAAAVAVGHTASDQAETVAFRRLRGDPREALCGMPVARPLAPSLAPSVDEEGRAVRLVRPLLAARLGRADVERYLRARAAHGLAGGFVEGLVEGLVDDPTNRDPRYTRSRLRASLAAAGPAGEATLLRLADAGAAQLHADEAAAHALGPLEELDAARVAQAGLGVLLRLLRRAGLHRAGVAHARALAALAAGRDGSATIDLGRAAHAPGDAPGPGVALVAERRYRRLRIGPAVPPLDDVALELSLAEVLAAPGPVHHALLGKVLVLQSLPTDEARAAFAEDPGSLLDPARLPEALTIRNLRAGDHFRGALGGRKLSDVLIDRKIPRPLRRGLLLLAPAGGGELLWVEGVGAAAPVRGGEPAGPHLQIRAFSPTGSGGAPPRRGG